MHAVHRVLPFVYIVYGVHMLKDFFVFIALPVVNIALLVHLVVVLVVH